ncbi:hypothetical protein OIU76_019197 [Salix suchowensis]|nr:hypothetical protein OIU76_019197 [Salix suchowensis]
MAKNKKKKVVSKLKKNEELRFGTNYEEIEDNAEEDDEFSSDLCKKDEAYASKFFFSSPMFIKGVEDCLVLHDSHAHPILQEEDVFATMFLGRGVGKGHPLLLTIGTANMAGSPHSSSSRLLGLGKFGSSSSPSIAKGIDDNVLSSSPSTTKESDAPLLGKVLGSMAAKNGLKDGQAMNGKWKDLFSSNRSAESITKLVLFSELNNASSCSLLENDLCNLKDVWKSCIVGFCKNCKVIVHNTSLCPHALDKNVPKAPVTDKVVSATEKILVKWQVPIKEVISDKERPIEQQLSDVPSWPKVNEEASRPNASEDPSQPNIYDSLPWLNSSKMPSRPNDVQGSSFNESFDEQRFDPIQMESNAGEWIGAKKRNGKSRMANDSSSTLGPPTVVVSSLGDPVYSVGINVDSLCGVTTWSGIRRTGVLPRSKGLKALAPTNLC